MLRTIFERWIVAVGCKAVYTAADGKSALALLQAQSPNQAIDMLVSDIRMPVMDGIALVRHLPGISHPTPAIIFVSGFGDIDLREMYDLGVEAFLSKPSDRRELLSAMEKALAERSSLWLEPMSIAPRQSLVLASGGSHIPGHQFISIGRGGFSAHASGPLSIGKVAFDCYFACHPEKQSDSRPDQEDCHLIGQGYVRWSSRADQTVGIEFAYLDPECRSSLVDEIARTHPRSFIPGSAT